MIPRFYDVTRGSVRVNGRDVRDYEMKELREKIGIVMQKNALFKGTIRENLQWGKGDAADEEMNLALEIAQAKYFVEDKEGGLYAPVAQGAGISLEDRGRG